MPSLSLPLQVLVAAPRPSGQDVPVPYHRLEALFAAAEAQGERLRAEWVWPPTPETLAQRLQADESTIKVVYLDVLLGDQEASPGVWFEDGQGAAVALSDRDLGALLGEAATVVLTSTAPGASKEAVELLAERLVASGVVSVVGVDSALSVEALERTLGILFSELLAGHTLGAAVAATDSAASLVGQDSPLVHLDLSAESDKIVRLFDDDARPAGQQLPLDSEPGGLPAAPSTGFVGRLQELQALERVLRGEHALGPILVHGYEGIGKTTFVAQAARWLARTGRFQQVVYTSFAGGGCWDTALQHLGAILLGGSLPQGEEEQMCAVEEALARTPTLVIWDQLDALLTDGELPLGAQELNALLQFGERVARAGASRLCVVSDSEDLFHPAFTASGLALKLKLAGLPPADAIELFGRSVDQHAPAWAEPSVRAHWAARLNGQPLALRIVASLSGRRTPDEMTALLASALPGFGEGEGRLGNQALQAALEAWFKYLPEKTSEALEALSIFVCGFMERLFARNMGFDDQVWAFCKQRLKAAGLVTEFEIPGLAVPYLRLHSSVARHLVRRLPPNKRGALTVKYCASYLSLMNWMTRNVARLQVPIKNLAAHELPNYRRVFRLLLVSGELNLVEDYVQQLAHFLQELGLAHERQVLVAELQNAISKVTPSEGPLPRQGVRYLLERSKRLLAGGQIAQAGEILQKLVARMGQEKGLAYSGDEAKLDHGTAFHQLGQVLEATGYENLAVPPYVRAVGLLESVENKAETHQTLLAAYQDLGGALMAVQQWPRAKVIYQRALALATQLKDERALGKIYAQSGFIAMMADEDDQARAMLQQAVEYLTNAKDEASLARAWGYLGTLAWKASQVAEAERLYSQAKGLAEKTGQTLLRAQMMMRLAQVAEQSDRIAEAQDHYARAIAIYQQEGVRAGLMSAETALAELLLREGELSKARVHAEAARAIVDGAGPQAQPWEVYDLLRRIAEADQDDERIAHWRTRARESFAESPQAKLVLRRWHPVIQGVAQACRGEALSAETVTLLERLEDNAGWQNLSATIWNILDGRRDEALFNDLDQVDALVVQRLLQAIEDPSTLEEPEQEEETGERQGGLQVSPTQMVSIVQQAIGGNERARFLADTLLRGLAQQPNAEPMKRFASALQRILQGERDPSLAAGLPAEAAALVKGLLSKLVRSVRD